MEGLKSTVLDCKIVPLKTIYRPEGALTVVEALPFTIKRSYYIYNVPHKSLRGEHAHKGLHQLIIAVQGSFRIILKDGKDILNICMDNPEEGLLIVPGIWREIVECSGGTVLLALVSEEYDESDYLRNYNDFINYKFQRNGNSINGKL